MKAYYVMSFGDLWIVSDIMVKYMYVHVIKNEIAGKEKEVTHITLVDTYPHVFT